MITRHAHILALMSISVASFGLAAGSVVRTTLIMAGLLAAAAVATVVYGHRTRLQPAPSGSPAARAPLMNTKRVLMLMLAIGIVAYGGGAGTFSTFSAETSNVNSSVASGTLTMSDQVNTGTACLSSSAVSSDNYQSGASGACDAALTLTNQAPGVFGGSAKITIANTGSIDASQLLLYAPYTNAVLATQINSGSTISTLTTTALEGNVVAGDTIELDYGGNTIQMIASANVSPTKTTIGVTTPAGQTGTLTNGGATVTGLSNTALLRAGWTVTGTGIPANTTISAITNGTTIVLSNNATAAGAQALTFTVKAVTDYKIGTRVYDISSNGSQANTDCFDQLTTSSPVGGATFGTNLNFNGTDIGDGSHWDSTNAFCSKLLFWVQEQTGPSQSSTTTNASTTVTVADSSVLAPTMSVTGPNIPANATISSITDGTHIVISSAATGSGTQSLSYTFNYCWVGQGSSGSSLPTANGMCYAPIAAAFSGNTTVTSSTTSLAFASALKGNIKSGDTVTISQTAKKIVTCTAGQNAYIGATSVTVSGCTSTASGWVGATGEAFTTAATIVDSTVNSGLNSDTTDTITNFDTSHSAGNKLELPVLNGHGSHVASGGGIDSIELAKHGSNGDTRAFYVGVFFPAGSGTAQNATQGLQASFGLSWRIQQ